jgi:hypothetical protein
MTALCRYIAADAVRSQRWVAPVLAFLVALLVIDAGGGSVLSMYAAGATALLFASTWLTVTVVNCEEPMQVAITTVNAGSSPAVHGAKLGVGLLGGLILGALALASAPLAVHGWTATDLLYGAIALILAAITGAAFGGVCGRPLIRSRAWAVLAAVALCLAEIVIPSCPPIRQLLVLFGRQHPHDLPATIVLTVVETIVVAGLLFAGTISVARRRD